jgi:hypothetical protein
MAQKQLPNLEARLMEFEGIHGTGVNGDNGVLAILLSLFSPSTLFPRCAIAQTFGLAQDVIGAAIEVTAGNPARSNHQLQ